MFACSTPAISTKKSNSMFKIQEETNLEGTMIYNGMPYSMAQRTRDGAILPALSSTAVDCFVGIMFPSPFTGIMNEISFFLDEFDSNKIHNNLFIEASTDNFVTSKEELVQVGEEAHEGWNYYDLTGLPNEFQYFRIRSAANW